MNPHRRDKCICLWFRLGTLFLLSSSNSLLGQGEDVVTISATEMLHSSEVTAYANYVTVYGKPSHLTYVYQNLKALPFSKFKLNVIAAGEGGDNRWPKLGIAFNDTSQLVSEIDINQSAFQTYDCGSFTIERETTLYLIFTNDYFNPQTGADVNLKIQAAEFVALAPRDTFIVAPGQFTLTWDRNQEADLAGYRIYHGLQSEKYLTPMAVHRDSTSCVFRADPGYYYYFAVAAYDTAQNQSALSPEIVVWVQPAALRVDSDLNGDGKCNAVDLQILSRAFGSTSTGSRYNPKADLNQDGKVNGLDMVLFSKNCRQ